MPPYYSRRVPRDRLPPETFDLPVEKIRAGYYTDAYFNFARDALLTDERHPRVLMQVFQKNRAILGGMDEAIAIRHLCSHDWDALAAAKFAEWAPEEMNVVVLVDFANDSVRTSLEVARALGPRLWGVRLDTSEQLVDRSLWEELGDFDPRGVNERLVRKVRAALDDDGFPDVRIVASGGFTAEKIRAFESAGVPVDVYGVGSSLLRGSNDFTADIVRVEGRPIAKVGRWERPNPRLEPVS